MGTNKPIVMERPQRGREMVSKQIAGQQKGKTMLMHEGYVGGAKYLVPDEDLEVMKELVDFKLGKKPMDRYVRDYDYTHLKQEPNEKFRKMSQRLQAMDTVSDESTVTEVEEEEEKPKDRKIRFEDSVEKEPETEESESTEEESEDPSQAEGSPTETQESITSGTSTSTTKTLPFEVKPTDGDRLRFLLSGHIRHNFKPIFIFHEFNGKSPFGTTPDFSSAKKEGAVDLFIRGKFYQESILEEANNKLVSLNIKPEKILIDDRCNVYEEQFYELLQVGEVQIDFLGKFIKQLDTKKYTPFLTFNVQNYPNVKEREKSKRRAKKQPAVVYLAQPSSQNLFEQKPAGDKERMSENKKKNVTEPASVPKAEGEPHLKKNPLRRPSTNREPTRGHDAGDVGSDRVLVYNCDVHRRKSSKNKNIFRRLSDMFFSRN